MPEPAIDTHAHVHFDQLAGDLLGVLDRARAAGIEAIINVGTGPAENGRVVETAARERMLYAAVGFHPHAAAQVKVADWSVLEDLARRPKVAALGEFGLDYHYKHSPPEVQRGVFAQGIRLARDLDLPLIIHAREADADVLAALDGAAAAGGLPRGVAHCFAGGPEFAREMLRRGFYVSFSGIITFKNADDVRQAARITPLERVLAETDSPYCAPVPFRGRTNEPANVVLVIRFLADLYGLAEDDVRRITTRNAAHLFGLPLRQGGPCLVYPIRRSLYVNLTNECSNRCTFCPRARGDLVVKGHDLRLPREPAAAELLTALEEAGAAGYEEAVFCGFGEPTLRLEVLKEVARRVKSRWRLPVRLNTNGQGSALAGRDITAELAGLVDAVSVSLDAPDAATYEKLCRPTVPNAFAAVCEFLRQAKARLPTVRATAVAVPGLDLEAVRRLAEEGLGVKFEVRAFNVVG
ncbi:MAG: YchF/TatD family DNA exonuclease [Planctomycetes bacterium]|nr:YchF/TatD family DNA exonuclease [Planctomycetota bacterium]